MELEPATGGITLAHKASALNMLCLLICMALYALIIGKVGFLNEQKFSHFIKNGHEKELDWYDQKAVHNKKIHDLLQVVVIVFSAVTPVLILINE